MKALFPFALFLAAAPAFASAPPAWYGRWDLTLTAPSGESGAWLELSPAGLRVVPRVGGVKSIRDYELQGTRLSFANTEWLGRWERVQYKLELRDGRIAGTAERESGPVVPVAGERAPALKRTVAGWGQSVKLDWPDWKVMSATKPGNWQMHDGVLTNSRGGPNLRTAGEFQDFRLDLEFNCPAGSNSGVVLRGRYEIQIEEEPQTTAAIERTGSVYQFLAPKVTVPRRPGEWRTLSVTLVGRTATVVLDGIALIDAQEIPGPTSGGFNSREGEPGPIVLQGDHGAISYRNIVLTPAETR